MTNKKVPKSSKIFSCEICDYNTIRKSQIDRHLMTAKHIILTNPNKKVPKSSAGFSCECGKTYAHLSSLSTHKKKCEKNEKIEKNEKNENSEIGFKEMFIEVMKQNQELRQTLQLVIPKVGNTTHITNNFNLHVFLNEQCKDALNIMDFVKSLQLQMNDLENTGRLGFVEGTSKIIIDGLRCLDVCKRPIHCSDIQNEILYVKDNNIWKQDNENKDTMKHVIDEVSKANVRQLSQMVTDKQVHMNDEEYMKIISNIMTANEETEKNEVINRVAKEVILDKTE